MLVREIMTTRVVSVSPETPVEEVARLIAERKISGVFVTEAGRPIGQISHTDLLRRTYPTHAELYEDFVHEADFEAIEHRAADLVGTPAARVMRKELLVVVPDTPVMKVAALMLVRDVHRAAVLEGAELAGVVSRGDVFYHLIRNEVLKKHRAGKSASRSRAKV